MNLTKKSMLIYQPLIFNSRFVDSIPDSDATESQFEPKLTWFEHLRLTYEKSHEEY